MFGVFEGQLVIDEKGRSFDIETNVERWTDNGSHSPQLVRRKNVNCAQITCSLCRVQDWFHLNGRICSKDEPGSTSLLTPCGV